jgi:RHS repeat-associated protein
LLLLRAKVKEYLKVEVKDKNEAEGVFYYHGDHLGSSSVVTDGDGDFYEHLEYFPYGEVWVNDKVASADTDLPYKFTSKEYDTETDLYYYGARYYDPKVSRWISVDPPLGKGFYFGKDPSKLPGEGGIFNPVNLNVYQFCFDNPVRFTDPDGNHPFVLLAIAGAAYYKKKIEPIHYNRNAHQQEDKFPTTVTPEILAKKGYSRFKGKSKNPEKWDRYHEQGKAQEGYDPSKNDKYVKVNEDGSSNEVVVNSETNKIITLEDDPVNGGTYNYKDGGEDPVGHFVYDMLPYYISGNSKEDAKTTTFVERISGTYKGRQPMDSNYSN